MLLLRQGLALGALALALMGCAKSDTPESVATEQGTVARSNNSTDVQAPTPEDPFAGTPIRRCGERGSLVAEGTDWQVFASGDAVPTYTFELAGQRLTRTCYNDLSLASLQAGFVQWVAIRSGERIIIYGELTSTVESVSSAGISGTIGEVAGPEAPIDRLATFELPQVATEVSSLDLSVVSSDGGVNTHTLQIPQEDGGIVATSIDLNQD